MAAGCRYAGKNEREREAHRARANRKRESGDRRLQARQAEADGALAELGLDAESPAHVLAKALEELGARLSRLAVVVARDLEAADVDGQRERVRAVGAEHRVALLALQERLDESATLRRAAEQAHREAELTTQAAELAAARATAERDDAVQARKDADRALRTSEAQAEHDADRAGSAVLAAQQLVDRLEVAKTAQAHAEAGRAVAEDDRARALSDVREQQRRPRRSWPSRKNGPPRT